MEEEIEVLEEKIEVSSLENMEEQIEIIEKLSLINHDLDLSNPISFVVQLVTICMFSTMIIGFAVKKLLQIVKG